MVLISFLSPVTNGDAARAVLFIYLFPLIRRLFIVDYSTIFYFAIISPCLFPASQAEKNKSHSGSPARDEVSIEAGDDGGEGTGGEDEGAGTDLEHDPNETMEDYEAALDTET